MLNRVKVMLFKVIKIGQNLDVNVEGFCRASHEYFAVVNKAEHHPTDVP